MKNIILGILLSNLLLMLSSCKTDKDVSIVDKSNSENNEIIKIENSKVKIIVKDKIIALKLGGLSFYIKALGYCNGDYSTPVITNGSVSSDGPTSGSSTSKFILSGVSFASGSTVRISNVSGTIVGPPTIITDTAPHSKTISVDVYITYTIIATDGNQTSSAPRNMVIPLSATIKE